MDRKINEIYKIIKFWNNVAIFYFVAHFLIVVIGWLVISIWK